MSEHAPPPTPSIDDIPQASALHTQWNTLNEAIALLGQPGATVSTVIVTNDAVEVSTSPNPPIAKPETLASLATALQAQADTIAQQLSDMGFDTSTTTRAG
jgi:hypothetical protein